MRIHSLNGKIVLLIILVMIIPLACQLPVNKTQATQTSIPVSEEDAKSFEEDLASAYQSIAENGLFQIEVHEQELTSWVVLQLQQNSAYQINNLQIYLRDEQVKITGSAVESGINVPLEIVMKMEIGQNQQVEINVLTAKVGPFKIPQAIVDEMKSQIQRSFEQQLAEYGVNYVLKSLTIQNGTLTIAGEVR